MEVRVHEKLMGWTAPDVVRNELEWYKLNMDRLMQEIDLAALSKDSYMGGVFQVSNDIHNKIALSLSEGKSLYVPTRVS